MRKFGKEENRDETNVGSHAGPQIPHTKDMCWRTECWAITPGFEIT